MEYQFRAAEPEDVDDIIGIIQERIDWMDEKNLYQWNRTNYMQRYPREYFLGRISSHEFYLAVDPEGKTVGVMALLLEDGRWTEDEKKNCYYVHHLATRPQGKRSRQSAAFLLRKSFLAGRQKGGSTGLPEGK